jgi:hypothetical protein
MPGVWLAGQFGSSEWDANSRWPVPSANGCEHPPNAHIAAPATSNKKARFIADGSFSLDLGHWPWRFWIFALAPWNNIGCENRQNPENRQIRYAPHDLHAESGAAAVKLPNLGKHCGHTPSK